MTLKIRLFNHLQVQSDTTRDNATLRPRAQRLLVYLLLHRKNPIPRKTLAFTLWPDMPEIESLGMLRRALSDLRAGLPKDKEWVSAARDKITWNSSTSCWLDINIFEKQLQQADTESLARAVELYTGALLMDMDEEWLSAERERFRQMQFDALRKLTAHHQSVREYSTALEFTRRALLLEPLSELVYQDRMRLQFLAGDRAAALAEYERLQTLLEKEIGVAPMEETRNLMESIARGEAVAKLEAMLLPSLASQVPPKLVGRETEVKKLAELWGEASRSRGNLSIISGEAGIGKSHLTRDLAYYVTQKGGLPLTGHCYEFENALPYQPIVDSLRPVVHIIQTLPLPVIHRAALAHLMPEVFVSEDVGRTLLSSDELRVQLFEALLKSFLLLSQNQPVLLILEDMHWASESVLDWLTFIAPRLTGNRMMVAITYRTEEIDPQHALPRLARRFEKEELVVPIPLQRLSRESNRQWVAHLSGLEQSRANAAADWLFAETAGNPFFLQEIVRGMLETGQIRVEAGQWSGEFIERTKDEMDVPLPDSLRETILARTRRLSELARAFLQAAAVAGRTFQFEIVSRAGGWADEQSLDALEDLSTRGFIREENSAGHFVFIHHLIREAIYANLTTPRKLYWHLHLAQTIRDVYPEEFETIAYHFIAAGEKQLGVDYSQKAAERAEALYAYEDASRHLRVALDLLGEEDHSDTRLALLESLADNYRLVRQGADAMSAYQSALGIIDGKTPRNIIIEARLYRKIYQTVVDMWENASAENFNAVLRVSIDLRPKVNALLTILKKEPPHVETVNLLRVIAVYTINYDIGEKEEFAFQFARTAVEFARRIGSPLILSTALTTLATVFGAFGFIRERLEVSQEALELSRESNFNDPLEQIQLLIAVGSSHAAVGEYEQAMVYFQDAERIAAQSRAISDQIRALSLLHLCLFRLDRWDEMLEIEDVRRVLQETSPVERIGAPCYAIGLSSAVHHWRGNLELSRKLKDESSAIMLSVVGSMENFMRSHYY